MQKQLEQTIATVLRERYQLEILPRLEWCDEEFGDYSTNIALQVASKVAKKPQEVAEELAEQLRTVLHDTVREVAVVAPGFINFRLNDRALWDTARAPIDETLSNQIVVVEYSDPNPFKVLHAGHLYTSVVGDAIANLFAIAGAVVHRVNFGGDVGLHVARTLWAILYLGTASDLPQFDRANSEIKERAYDSLEDRSAWLAQCYQLGTTAYEEDLNNTKQKIAELNKQIYQLHADDDHESALARIYWTCRQWSYDYFEMFYDRIGCHFEKYYPESATLELGVKTVKAHLGSVFAESEGAIVFHGEKYGLHTRVFITQQGLPTYETKDVGLTMLKWNDYHFNRSVIITGSEQQQYMAVVLKAIEQFEPEIAKLAANTTHLTHGVVKLQGGVKMSSRKGKVILATDVLDTTVSANKAISGNDNEKIMLGAVKYSFLKQRLGGDIIYDPVESVSLKGNSGPYLQYAYVRAMSILSKAPSEAQPETIQELEADERTLLRKLSQYPAIVDQATRELLPHHICTYLYELAQTFNYFYEHNRVLNHERQTIRLALATQYAQVLQAGLILLGIPIVDKM